VQCFFAQWLTIFTIAQLTMLQCRDAPHLSLETSEALFFLCFDKGKNSKSKHSISEKNYAAAFSKKGSV